MSITKIDYLVLTNEDWLDGLVIEDDDGPIDIVGSSFRADIRETVESLSAVISATAENGMLVISLPETEGGGEGELSWNVPEAVMKHIEPGVYFYDLVWTRSDGAVDTIAYGEITVQRGVTR